MQIGISTLFAPHHFWMPSHTQSHSCLFPCSRSLPILILPQVERVDYSLRFPILVWKLFTSWRYMHMSYTSLSLWKLRKSRFAPTFLLSVLIWLQSRLIEICFIWFLHVHLQGLLFNTYHILLDIYMAFSLTHTPPTHTHTHTQPHTYITWLVCDCEPQKKVWSAFSWDLRVKSSGLVSWYQALGISKMLKI